MTLIGVLTLPGMYAFLFALMLLNNGARGTHRRYVYRTLQTPMIPLALLNQASQLLSNLQGQDFFWAGLNIFNLCWIGFYARSFYASDEDDWWKNTFRRLKRALRGAFSARACPQPLSITASTR